MNFSKLKKQQGFTIVELLIVIVVIGILAAITIVAYNGIQNRGKTAAGQSLANSIAKKVEAFNTVTSAYPIGALSAASIASVPESVVADAASFATGATTAAAHGQSAAKGAGGTVVTGWGCTLGANVWYWDYSTSAAVAVKAGAGC